MQLFRQVFHALNKAKVKYVVVGGVAANLHGYLRFTGDLDIILLLKEENLKRMEKVMKDLGYSERLPVSIMELKNEEKVRFWLKEKNLKAFTFNPPPQNALQIDIIMEESLEFDKIYPRRVMKKIENISIPIVSVQDFIKMKKKANREQDFLDIEAILKLENL